MKCATRRNLSLAASCIVLLGFATLSAFAQTTDITSTPSSLVFPNTYVGIASGAKVLTITNVSGGGLTITAISFDCASGFGISSGIAPFSFGATQSITHYSIYFQPTVAQTYSCNFVISLNDGTHLDVPLTGTGLTSTAVASVSPTTLNFPNQTVGTTSAGQTINITNTGTSGLQLTNITTSPLNFSTSAVTLPVTIYPGTSLPITVYYSPNSAISQNGTLDLTYNSVVDDGVTLTGNGVPSTPLIIASSTTLPQATQNAAYQASLATSGGTGPFTWSVSSGSLPSGLALSSSGEITGTLASSVATGNYSFGIKVTDSKGASASNTMTIGVFANLADNCNDIIFDVPGTTTPMTALTDLGTGTYQGSEGGLYPSGSNVRPASHDSDGVNLAKGIVPLDANGNYSPTGKYVMLAVGESTAQNEFNRFLPIANADPSKNPYLVIVNGSQGGATPFNFESTTSAYWNTVLNNYLPQNGVTPQQVVVIWMEDTDGISTGTFPTDIAELQTEYETMMQTMHTLFPNLKMVYFSSRVYGGYSNGVGNPDNPEPYAYEVGFAVKWAIQDQLNGNANLNYNPNNGPVVAPWMSWGPYYWANGMLGRNDGLEWDCADFSSDGTHPSSTYGQLKVATALLQFLKTDDTAIPWFLAPSLTLSPNAGNNQTGNVGTTLPTPLTVLAANGSTVEPGVTVTFNDNGANGKFNPTSAVTNSSGLASTSYTLPATAQTVSISVTASGYAPATFIETATATVSQVLAVNGGNNQSGSVSTTLPTALSILATNNGTPVSGVTVTFNDNGAGGTFGSPTAVTNTSGIASSTYTLPSTSKTITVTVTASGYTSATFTETATQAVSKLGLVSGGQQTGTVGQPLPLPLVVKAKNSSGQIVVGASITFSSPQGGSFSPNPAITDSSGNATTTYTLPTIPESITMTATSGTVSINIGSKSVAGPPAIVKIISGNNQTAGTNTKLPKSLGVKLTDQYGNALSGFTISFTDNGAGGTFGTPNPVTSSSGQAGTTYTTGPTAGTIKINATESSTVGVRFSETVN
ncbi:MAG TPA: choice-of-anchor D domain-containing protein [Candidatus Sulfotelmatobacter sp.]|nr:choice-of-anchor D domain-containing protein [Candidatus Sulfotelmatobacter sp.]